MDILRDYNEIKEGLRRRKEEEEKKKKKKKKQDALEYYFKKGTISARTKALNDTLDY